MPVPVDSSDSSIWTAFVLGLLSVFGTMGGGCMYLLGQISKVRETVTQQGTDDLKTALNVEKRFATKEDIDRLEKRLNESMRAMLREHEVNVNRDMDRRIAELRSLGRG